MGNYHRYSKEQIEFLKENIHEKSFREIADLFNKKYNTNLCVNIIKSTCHNHKLINSNIKEKINFIKENIDGTPYKELTKLFNEKFNTNVTIKNMMERCSYMNLKNNNQVKELGEEKKINGITYVRIVNGRKIRKSNWRAKHLLIWEETYGPLGEDDRIIFADKNFNNITLDNLIKVSRRECFFLSQNGLRYEVPDLTHAGVAIAQLDTAIAQRKKELQQPSPTPEPLEAS